MRFDVVSAMLDNHPVGEVRYKFKYGSLKGSFNKDGLPDGTWAMDILVDNVCKIDYDLWANGTLKDCYTLNTSTGRKKPRNNSLVDFLSSYIYRECHELENIIQVGSRKWEGNITLK
ncbi:MAG: hypothetical protein Q4D41_12390 [Prevotellaceae bacterium]|nr:hypothetical protein [Prevotellaceae bacterium]